VSIRLVCCLVVILLFMGNIALAADGNSDSLLLSEVVTEALAKNSELQVARQRWRAAQERPTQAAALDDPEFKVELFNYPERFNPDASSNTIFGLSQRFPYPGKRALKKNLALKDVEIVEAHLRQKEREIAAQVKVVYYELFLDYKAIEVHHQQIAILKQLFEIANARFRAGKGAQVDALKSSLELSKLFNQLPILEQHRESAKAKLNLLMNRLPQEALGVPEEPSRLVAKPTFEELRELAVQNRPELTAFMKETARSETAIALAQKQFYPDFNVMVERFQNFGARDGFGGMVAVTLPFSFWTKPKYDAGVREARANLESAKAAYQALENQVAFEVKDVLVKIEATEKLVKMYKTTVLPQAQQTLDSARIAYQNARVEFLTLLDAERGLRDFQLEYYRVLTALGQHNAELERVVGFDLNSNDTREGNHGS
jgi:outer membrane protein, heavy metal efflux system